VHVQNLGHGFGQGAMVPVDARNVVIEHLLDGGGDVVHPLAKFPEVSCDGVHEALVNGVHGFLDPRRDLVMPVENCGQVAFAEGPQ